MYIKATATRPDGRKRVIILDTAHPDEVIPFGIGKGSIDSGDYALKELLGGKAWPAGYVLATESRSEHTDIEPEGGRYQRVRLDNQYGNNRPGILDVVTMQYNAWSDTTNGNLHRDETFERGDFPHVDRSVSACTDIRPDPLPAPEVEQFELWIGTYDSGYINTSVRNSYFITNTEHPDLVWGCGGGQVTAEERLAQFRTNAKGWEAQYAFPIDRYTDTKRIDPEEDNNMATVKQDGVDYKAKYEKLVEDLYAEAKRRNWCSDFDAFAEKVGIEKPKPKYKPEPSAEAIVKFDGMVPASGTYGALGTKRWSFLSTPSVRYTWEEVNEKARQNHSGTFEIMWSL
jgi:hypothetical protein